MALSIAVIAFEAPEAPLNVGVAAAMVVALVAPVVESFSATPPTR